MYISRGSYTLEELSSYTNNVYGEDKYVLALTKCLFPHLSLSSKMYIYSSTFYNQVNRLLTNITVVIFKIIIIFVLALFFQILITLRIPNVEVRVPLSEHICITVHYYYLNCSENCTVQYLGYLCPLTNRYLFQFFSQFDIDHYRTFDEVVSPPEPTFCPNDMIYIRGLFFSKPVFYSRGLFF